MVYGIVKQHSGFITVTSRKGQGTTFSIYLPLSRTDAAAVKMGEPDTVDIHGTETVLVVEDDPAVRTLNKAILETFGYRVIEARDGDDAVARFECHRDDIRVIVMDVVMPKMNGRKTYAEICRIRPGVKVLFVSGYASDVIMDKGIGTEGFHFIPKPLKPLDLVKKIRAILDS
jgi:CheY-like chemotaxis protein